MSAEPEKHRQEHQAHGQSVERKFAADVREMVEAWRRAGKPRKR